MATAKLGLHCLSYTDPVTFVTRLSLDAVLHAPPGPQPAGKRGPKPKKGERLWLLK